jgi:hypothetical protein
VDTEKNSSAPAVMLFTDYRRSLRLYEGDTAMNMIEFIPI